MNRDRGYQGWYKDEHGCFEIITKRFCWDSSQITLTLIKQIICCLECTHVLVNVSVRVSFSDNGIKYYPEIKFQRVDWNFYEEIDFIMEVKAVWREQEMPTHINRLTKKNSCIKTSNKSTGTYSKPI